MDINALIQDGLMLTGRRFYSVVLSTVANYIVAAILGPINLGFLSIIRMIPYIGALLNPGWLEASMRERLHNIGAGVVEGKIEHTRNVAYTAQLYLGFFWLIIFLLASFFAPDNKIRLCIIVGTAIYLIMLATQFIVQDITVKKEFNIQAKVSVAGATLNFVLMILFAYLWGVVGVLTASCAVLLTELILYLRIKKFRLEITWDKGELKRLTKIGLPLALLTLLGSASGLIQWTERTVITSFDGLETLGFFVFSMTVVSSMTLFINEVMSAYQAHFWEALGANPNQQELQKLIYKPALVNAYLAAGLSILAFIFIPPFVLIFLSKYNSILPAIQIIALIFCIDSIGYIPIIFLRSTFANQQVLVTVLRIISITVYVISLWVLVGVYKYGLIGALYSTLIYKVVMTSLVITNSYKYFTDNTIKAIHFVIEQILPILFVITAFIIFRYLIIHYFASLRPNDISTTIIVSAATLIFTTPLIVIGLENKTHLLSRILASIKTTAP